MFNLPLGLFMAWAGAITFYFTLFWAYLPFALAAREYKELTRRFA